MLVSLEKLIKEFEESRLSLSSDGLTKMRIWYSKRPGTPAATAPNQVDQKVMAERAKNA